MCTVPAHHVFSIAHELIFDEIRCLCDGHLRQQKMTGQCSSCSAWQSIALSARLPLWLSGLWCSTILPRVSTCPYMSVHACIRTRAEHAGSCWSGEAAGVPDGRLATASDEQVHACIRYATHAICTYANHTYKLICVYACVYTCVHTCVYISIYTHTHIHIYIYIYTPNISK